MFNPPSALTILLFVTLSINLVGVLLGGLYFYKTRFYNLRLFKTALRRRNVSLSIPWGYHGLKVNEFKMLSEKASGKKAIIFAGDSMMEEFEWHEHFPTLDDVVILKRAIGGETLDHFTDRIPLTLSSKYDIQMAFIMIGINDIRKTSFEIEVFKKRFQELLEKLLALLPADRICLHSLFPTCGDNATISNSRVKQVNEYLEASALEKKMCYIDLYDQLTDFTGHLDVKYTYDGLHLSFEGYKIWIEALTPYVLKAMKHAQHQDAVASISPLER